MKIGTVLSVVLTMNLIVASATSPAFADPPPPEHIQFSPSATKGALYYPDPGLFPSPHIAFIFMHRNGNFLSHLGTSELSKRGFDLVVRGLAGNKVGNDFDFSVTPSVVRR